MELVDWVRLADHSLHPSEALRLTFAMEKLHPPSVKSLVESFYPDRDLFWQLLPNSTVASEWVWRILETEGLSLTLLISGLVFVGRSSRHPTRN